MTISVTRTGSRTPAGKQLLSKALLLGYLAAKGNPMLAVLFVFLCFLGFESNSHAILVGAQPFYLEQIDPFPEVGFVPAGGTGCTGTLVGPRIVITAAHCYVYETWHYPENEHRVPPPGRNYAEFVLGRGTARQRTYTGSWVAHPGFESARVPWHYDIGTSVKDIAVILLDEEVSNLRPMSLTCDTPRKDDQLLFIGYGSPHLGRKQLGWADVEKTSARSILIQNEDEKIAADSGDSGGPVFRIGAKGKVELVGVSSTSSRQGDSTYWAHPEEFRHPYRTGVSRVITRHGTDPVDDPAWCLNRFYADPLWRYVLSLPSGQICGVNIDC